MKKIELYDGHQYATDKNWVFGLDDDKQRQFGLYIETVDMYDATGDESYEQYPFVVSFSIVADKCHKSFAEQAGNGPDHKPDKLGLIMDCVSYMGGIPVDHLLTDAVKSSSESGEAFDALAAQFSVNEACVINEKPQYGTVAAQRGPGSEFKYLRFKTENAAEKYVDYILKHRTGALGMMIGFTLDRPINI